MSVLNLLLKAGQIELAICFLIGIYRAVMFKQKDSSGKKINFFKISIAIGFFLPLLLWSKQQPTCESLCGDRGWLLVGGWGLRECCGGANPVK